MGLFTNEKSLAAQLKAAAEKIEAQATEIADLQAKLGAAEVVMQEIAALREAAQKHDALLAEHSALVAELAAVKATLANPPAVYAQAIEGRKPVEDNGEKSAESLWAQYHKISDPKQKTLFYRKHRDEMNQP